MNRPVVLLLLEVHSRVGDAVVAALKHVKPAIAPTGAETTYASIWLGPEVRQPETAVDTLEQAGLVRVFGPAPIHQAEVYREKLGFALFNAGCDLKHDVTVDD